MAEATYVSNYILEGGDKVRPSYCHLSFPILSSGGSSGITTYLMMTCYLLALMSATLFVCLYLSIDLGRVYEKI